MKQITNKDILDNKPEGAVHYAYESDYMLQAYFKDDMKLVYVPDDLAVWQENTEVDDGLIVLLKDLEVKV